MGKPRIVPCRIRCSVFGVRCSMFDVQHSKCRRADHQPLGPRVSGEPPTRLRPVLSTRNLANCEFQMPNSEFRIHPCTKKLAHEVSCEPRAQTIRGVHLPQAGVIHRNVLLSKRGSLHNPAHGRDCLKKMETAAQARDGNRILDSGQLTKSASLVFANQLPRRFILILLSLLLLLARAAP